MGLEFDDDDRFIQCAECDMYLIATWMVDGFVLTLDTMLEDKDYPNKTPFQVGHTHPNMMNCPKCGERFTGVCLVNHPDGSACGSCPNHGYISKSEMWVRTSWTEDDLVTYAEIKEDD